MIFRILAFPFVVLIACLLVIFHGDEAADEFMNGVKAFFADCDSFLK
jgi:hypothetical protein